jgi:hypothetical protein
MTNKNNTKPHSQSNQISDQNSTEYLPNHCWELGLSLRLVMFMTGPFCMKGAGGSKKKLKLHYMASQLNYDLGTLVCLLRRVHIIRARVTRYARE